MSTHNESNIHKASSSKNDAAQQNKKIIDDQSFTDSGFLSTEIQNESCELSSEENISSNVSISKADNKVEINTDKMLTGNSQDSESIMDSGIVSCSNISLLHEDDEDRKSKIMHQVKQIQHYVPEYMTQNKKLHGMSKIQSSLQIEKYFEQDEDGYTKLHIAILHNIEPAIHALINYCPDPAYLNIKNYCGQTALHLAVLMSQSLTIRKLIDAGADINSRDNRCNSSLHLAILNEDIECVQTIIAAVYPSSNDRDSASLIANLEQWNLDGESCFYAACRVRNVPTIKILAANGCNVNAREGKSGYTALHLAVEMRSNEIIKFLCENCEQINLDIENYGGLTAFQLSLLTQQNALAEYLIKKGATAFYTPDSDLDETDDDLDESCISDYEEMEKNQLVNKIAEIAVN